MNSLTMILQSIDLTITPQGHPSLMKLVTININKPIYVKILPVDNYIPKSKFGKDTWYSEYTTAHGYYLANYAICHLPHQTDEYGPRPFLRCIRAAPKMPWSSSAFP